MKTFFRINLIVFLTFLFSNPTSYGQAPGFQFKVMCENGGNTILSLPGGYTNYDWYQILNSENITLVQSGATNTLNLASLGTGKAGYFVLATSSGGGNPTPFAVGNFHVKSDITPSLTLNSVCSGEAYILAGENGEIYKTYTWSDGINTTVTTTPVSPRLTQSGTYTVQVEDFAGCTATASIFVDIGSVMPAVDIIPIGSTELCIGSSLQLSASVQSSSYNYKWFRDGFHLSVYPPTASQITVYDAASYTLEVSTNTGTPCVVVSNPITVTYQDVPRPVISSSEFPEIQCGEQITLSVPSIYNTYQWRKNGTAIPSATSETLIVTEQGTYSIMVSKGLCSVSSQNFIPVSVIPPTIDVSGATDFTCGDQQTVLSVPTGYSSYTWLLNGSTIQTGSSPTYTVISSGGSYKVRVTNGSCSVDSDPVQINVVNNVPKPTIHASGELLINSATYRMCPNGDPISATAGFSSYSWQRSGAVVSSGPSNLYTPDQSGFYRVTVYDQDGCSNTSDQIGIQVNSGPPSIYLLGPELCGSSSQVATDNFYKLYTWSNGVTGTANSILVSSPGSYSVTVTDYANCQFTTSSVTVSSGTPDVIPVISGVGNTTICEGSKAKLKLDNTLPSTGQFVLMWRNNLNPNATITGFFPPVIVSGITLPTGLEVEPTEGGNYSLEIFQIYSLNNPSPPGWTPSYCFGPSNSIQISVLPKPQMPTISNIYSCGSGDVTMNAVGSPGTVNYKWYDDARRLFNGETSSSLIQHISAGTERYYYVSAVDGNGCESDLKSFSAYAINKPAKPQDISITRCGEGDHTIFIDPVLGISKYRVYDAITGGNLIAETNTTSFIANITSSTTFYVASVQQGPIECESDRGKIIIDLLFPPVISPSVSICYGNQVTLTANPVVSNLPVRYHWYNSSGNQVWQSSQPTYTIFSLGATSTFYVAVKGASGGCESARSPVTVVVNPLPQASISSTNSPVCSGSTADVNLSLTGTPPFSLTYYINGISSTVSDINSNSYTISWTLNSNSSVLVTAITDATNCSRNLSLSSTIAVNPVTPVSFAGLSSPYCKDPGLVVPLTPNIAGGFFSGHGITGNTFSPIVVSEQGPYNITYTYINNHNCVSSYSVPVTVFDLPVADFSGHNSEYCLNDPASEISVSPIGGTLSGTGITYNSVENKFYFTPSNVGARTIIYSITDGNGCSDTEQKNIVVHDLPTVSFSGLDATYCVSDPVEVLIGTPSNGVFSGTGINGESFNPAAAGQGNYTITYSYTDANGCSNSESDATVVNALPVVDFTGLNSSYCINNAVAFLSPTPWGGTFSGPGIIGNSFDPSLAGVGEHTITYMYTDNFTGCANSISKQVEVYTLPDIDFALDSRYCQNQSINLAGTPSGGTFSGNAVSGITFNPTWFDDFTITYSYTDPGTNCSSSISKTTTVNSKPVIYNPQNGSRCGPGEVLITMDPISSPYVYRWFDGSNNLLSESAINTFLTPTISTSTSYSVKLFNTSTGCESDAVSSTAIINQPAAPIVNGPTVPICPGLPFTLMATGGVSEYRWYSTPSGGSPIGWAAALTVSGGITSPTTYYVSTVDYNNPPHDCESPRTAFTVNVVPTPIPAVTQAVNCGSTILTVSGGSAGSIYNWYTDASENTPVYSSAAPTFELALPNIYLTNRFYVQIQNATCSSARTSVDVQFLQIPTPPSSTLGASRCGSGEVTLNAWGAWGGMVYQWFTSPSGGTPVGETNKSQFTVFVTNTTQYYVGIKSSEGCQSLTRIPVTATVNTPPAPIINDQMLIGPGGVTLTASGAPSGFGYRWYRLNGTKLGEGASYYSYYNQSTTLLVCTVDYTYNCEGPRIPVTVTVVNDFPLSADNSSICLAESATLSAPAGYTYQWTGGGIDITTSQPVHVSPVVTTTYTAREVNSNITSQITITVTNCVPSGALHYDGADDLVEVHDEGRLNLGTGPFTMEALIRSDRLAPGGIQVILSKRNTSETDGFLFGLWSDGHLWMQLRGVPNMGYNQGPTILDGQCHHVAVTRDSLANLKFYIDGNLTYQAVNGRDIGSLGDLRIGRNNFTGLFFDGLIGEVRIWNYERSQTQLQNEVNVRLSPQSGLLAYYVMEDGEGSQVVSDLSGFNNHGRLGSSTSIDNLDPVWVTGPFSCTVQGNFKSSFSGDTPVSNDTLASVTSIEAYPNPFQNQTTLYLKGEGMFGNATLVITDLNGIEVFRKEEVSINEEILTGGELRAGVYFVQVLSEGKVQTIKLIKTE